MKLSFRWYGASDPIPLDYIRQIPGMRSVVTAVYDVKPGEVWPEESLADLKTQCEAHGLVFDVVESIPVSEDIKLGTAKRDAHLQAYCENIRRCAKYGVKCVTYNFMPVFDWTRTQLDKQAPDGSTSLVMYWDQLNGLDPLKDDIHLPGWDSSYTQAEVRDLIRAYNELGDEGLWKNIEIFLHTVIPVAEECGVVMALHPDDPPTPSSACPGSSPVRRIWTGTCPLWTPPPTACACVPAPWAAPNSTKFPPWCGSMPAPAALVLCTSAT